MKKIAVILTSVLALGLASCGTGQPLGDPNPPLSPSNGKITVNGEDDYTFETVVINGMDCVILENETHYGHVVVTFDCDWDSGGK